jgi:hypothetical protein
MQLRMKTRCLGLLFCLAFVHFANARTFVKVSVEGMGASVTKSAFSSTFHSYPVEVGVGIRFISDPPPTFNNPGPITICINGSYYLNPSTTAGTWLSTNPSVASVSTNGYVTGLSLGITDISLTTVLGTVTATITVGSTSSVAITDPIMQPSYKFDNNPHGPVGGTINYVGYNGFNYSSQTQPTNRGYYMASKQVGNEAGCPVSFYIMKCNLCVVSEDVLNGLIVNLDATNSSSYSGTGTTWRNLGIGGASYNATLTNSPTHESGTTGNLYFNKSTSGSLQQYAALNINTGSMNAWTMEVIAKIPDKGIWTVYPFVQISDYVGYNRRGAYIGVQGGTINYSPNGDNFQSYQITNDIWYIITVVHSKNLTALYLNGVFQGGWTFVNNDNLMGSDTINPLYIGNSPDNINTSVQQVKISKFKFYAKALTASEIANNFSTQKSRYGL